MIEEALEKLGVGEVILVVHSMGRRAGRADGAGLSRACCGPGDAGAGGLSMARLRRLVQRGRYHAGGRSAAGLYDITLPLGLLLAGPGARGVFLPQAMPENFITDTAMPSLLRPREFLANARDLVTLKAAVREQAPRDSEIKGADGDHFRRRRQDRVDEYPFAPVRRSGV